MLSSLNPLLLPQGPNFSRLFMAHPHKPKYDKQQPPPPLHLFHVKQRPEFRNWNLLSSFPSEFHNFCSPFPRPGRRQSNPTASISNNRTESNVILFTYLYLGDSVSVRPSFTLPLLPQCPSKPICNIPCEDRVQGEDGERGGVPSTWVVILFSNRILTDD